MHRLVVKVFTAKHALVSPWLIRQAGTLWTLRLNHLSKDRLLWKRFWLGQSALRVPQHLGLSEVVIAEQLLYVLRLHALAFHQFVALTVEGYTASLIEDS